MRLNINLASQKYEDVRQFYVRWVTAIAWRRRSYWLMGLR